MKKIFLCRNTSASWAIRDKEILSREHEVFDFFISSPKSYLKNFWFLKLFKANVVFCWFASYSFLPVVVLAKILGKKIVIVSGGFDASREYGTQRIRRKMFSWADRVLCVSKANLAETIINSRVPSEKCELVYHGFEPLPSNLKLKSWEKRENQVVMISHCNDFTYYRKGIDQFIKLAASIPDFNFVLIGNVNSDFEHFLRNYTTPNFSIAGPLQFRGEEFNQILNDSKFIVQLSQYESFGCAVIDGSIMGCLPITSNQVALFEVTEGIGSTFAHGDLPSIKSEILRQAGKQNDSNEISKISLGKFGLNERKRKILGSIDFD